jgi:starvation-inducible DNA-binding protein
MAHMDMDMMESSMESSMGSQSLAENLAECLSNTVVWKFKTHGFHWNVKGPDFREFHKFFGTLYKDAEEAIDPLGELILTRGGVAPSKLFEFAKMSSIVDTDCGSDPMAMLADARKANEVLIECLNETFASASATATNDQGVANFIADRIAAHSKWNWQISAFLGMSATDKMSKGSEVEVPYGF